MTVRTLWRSRISPTRLTSKLICTPLMSTSTKPTRRDQRKLSVQIVDNSGCTLSGWMAGVLRVIANMKEWYDIHLFNMSSQILEQYVYISTGATSTRWSRKWVAPINTSQSWHTRTWSWCWRLRATGSRLWSAGSTLPSPWSKRRAENYTWRNWRRIVSLTVTCSTAIGRWECRASGREWTRHKTSTAKCSWLSWRMIRRTRKRSPSSCWTVLNVRSLTLRHVSTTCRVAFDWLFDRINLD